MISVIVPVYNTSSYLRKCLDSVIAQKLGDMEILLIDDGSNDGSEKICDEYAQKDKRIHVIHKKNEGLLKTRQYGVNHAKGELIGFVDSDDYIAPDMFSELCKQQKLFKCDLVSSAVICEHASGETTINCDNYAEGVYDDLDKDIYPSMLFDFDKNDFGLYCNLVSKVFRRDLIKRTLDNMDMRITFGEDAAVFYRYCLLADRIQVIHAGYYHYRIREGTMCTTKHEQLLLNTLYLYESLKGVFEKHPCKFILMRQLRRYIMNIEGHSLDMFFDISPGILDDWIFNYDETIFKHPFVIYGAGNCGQAFFHYIRKNGWEDNISAWVDINPEKCQARCDFEIMDVRQGLSGDYEHVVIAIKNGETAREVKDEICRKYKIPDYKVVWGEVCQKSHLSSALA